MQMELVRVRLPKLVCLLRRVWRLSRLPGVCDDLKGGWTNRYAYEFTYRFEQRAMYRRAWLPALLWTSETYDAALVREEVLQCVYRVVHVQRHGAPRTSARCSRRRAT